MITVAIEPEGDNAAGIAAFVFEMGILKRLRRAGWWHVGVRDPDR
jgi:putative hydrolase of HD superfamily